MNCDKLNKKFGKLKIAFSHDWLTGMRGGERVLEALSLLFPDAPIYTLFLNKNAISQELLKHPITTSFLQRLPYITRYYRNMLPFFPIAAGKMRINDDLDLLISTSHCVAKGVRKPQHIPHICYCFTPMRYAWLFFEEYFGKNVLKRLLAKPLLTYLRKWDYEKNENVSHFIAISKVVQDRIRSFYNREAPIIYPPVKADFWLPGKPENFLNPFGTSSFDIVVSALVPYKRIDLVVEAYTKKRWNLVIVGTGTEYEKLKKIAGKNIIFTERITDQELLNFYRAARAMVFPAEEDFGISPVEAQACGKPVIAFARGGATETVIDKETGILFKEQTIDCLVDAVEKSYQLDWDVDKIRRNAERFSVDVFLSTFASFIEQVVGKKP